VVGSLREREHELAAVEELLERRDRLLMLEQLGLVPAAA
jgi:hypothetical protein